METFSKGATPTKRSLPYCDYVKHSHCFWNDWHSRDNFCQPCGFNNDDIINRESFVQFIFLPPFAGRCYCCFKTCIPASAGN